MLIWRDGIDWPLDRSSRDRRQVALLCGVAMLCLAFFAPSGASAFRLREGSHIVSIPSTPSLTRSTVRPYYACPPDQPGPHCDLVSYPPAYRHAIERREAANPNSTRKFLTGSGHGIHGTGLAPGDLRHAYNLPSSSSGSGQTVGVVLWENDPFAEADMNAYRAAYGIPECKSSTGCFKKVNQNGVQGSYPPNGSKQMGEEASLDLEMVSAVCPNCHIIFVEANKGSTETQEREDMGAAENTAVSLGATVVSNSWSEVFYNSQHKPIGGEFAGETSYDHYYNHPGVPIVFANGEDEGFGTAWPATSPYVISVGATELEEAPGTSRGWSESVAPLSGSGCSKYEPKPAWQTDGVCPNRMTNDIAAVGAFLTPVSIYDSYRQTLEETIEYWTWASGSSVATPIIAATYALADNYTRSLGPQAVYMLHQQGGSLNDITEGNDTEVEHFETCTVYFYCYAQEGYDGPTGWGTPWGAPIVTPPPPPPAPGVITSNASERKETGATLHAWINPNGLDTHYYFQYGTTTSYGSSVPLQPTDIGSGSQLTLYGTALSGLHPGRTYHYRVVATSSGGTADGEDMSFTTRNTISAFATGASQLSLYNSGTESSMEAQQSAMASGASPSLAIAQNGNYYGAYRASTGALAVYSSTSASSTVTSSQVMPGSNPSVAALATGGYEVAFESTNGALALYSSVTQQTTATSLSIAEGSNPSIAAYLNGGFEVAYEGNAANLYVYSSLTGVATNTSQAMKPSTSPSLGILFSNQLVVAYQSSGSKFAVYSSATGTSTVTTTSMTAGTSPSLVVLLNGNYEAAFLSSSGEIWTYESANGRVIPRTQAVAAGTSPSLANIPGEGCKIAFQASTNFLAIFSCQGGSRKVTTSAMKAGTSPSIVMR